jgi:hypothetical protein
MTPVVGWTVISPFKEPLLLAPLPFDAPNKMERLDGGWSAPVVPGVGVAKVRLSEQLLFTLYVPLPVDDWEPAAPFTEYWVMVKLPAPSKLRTPIVESGV